MEGLGILFAGLGILLFLYVGIIVLLIAAYWIVFTKAGKPGWAVLVPIYNIIVMLQIVGKPWWWLFLFIIPGVNLVFGIWTINLLSKSFGKDVGFTIGIIFLSFIFIPILAFGKSTYIGPAGNNFGKTPEVQQ